MSGTGTIGWLTTRTGELDNVMSANSSTDQLTVVNNLGQAVLTIGAALPLSAPYRIEMELGAALGQMLQVQYEVNQPGGTVDTSKFYSLLAGGATLLGAVVFLPEVAAGGAIGGGSIVLSNTLRAMVISGTLNAFMTGPNFLALADWIKKNITPVFDPSHPRSSDAYPLALTDRANWMLYSEMYSLGIRTGKVAVDGKRGVVSIKADKMIMIREVPEDQQTPFMGRKGGGFGGGAEPVPGGGGGGSGGGVKIYWPEP